MKTIQYKLTNIYEQANIKDILPGNKRLCPKCKSAETNFNELEFLQCNNCKKVTNFWDAIFFNLGKYNTKDKEEFINKLYDEYVQTTLPDTEIILREIDLSKVEEVKLISEIQDKIKNMSDRSMLMIEAPTGVGKTYNLVKAALEEWQRGNQVTFICSTKNEIKKATNLFIQLSGFLQIENILDEIDHVISDNKQIRSRKKFKNIIITTYAYLATKGHSKELYKVAKHILKDRCVFADEIQAIEEYSKVIIPLGNKYLKKGSLLEYSPKCPKYISKGSCQNCFHHSLLVPNSFLEFEPIKKFIFESEENKLDKCTENTLFKPDFYTGKPIHTVLFEKITDLEEFKYLLKDFPEVMDNIDLLENLHVKMQLPLIEDEDGKILYLRKEEIIEKMENTENEEK